MALFGHWGKIAIYRQPYMENFSCIHVLYRSKAASYGESLGGLHHQTLSLLWTITELGYPSLNAVSTIRLSLIESTVSQLNKLA